MSHQTPPPCSEGLHGIRNSFDTMGYNATVFPQVTGMAATANFSLIFKMARVMADEARALNNVAERAGASEPGGRAGIQPTAEPQPHSPLFLHPRQNVSARRWYSLAPWLLRPLRASRLPCPLAQCSRLAPMPGLFYWSPTMNLGRDPRFVPARVRRRRDVLAARLPPLLTRLAVLSAGAAFRSPSQKTRF